MWARASFVQLVSSPIPPALNAPVRLDLLGGFETQYGAQLLGATIMRIRGYVTTVGPSTSAMQLRVTARIGTQNEIVRGPNANDNAFDVNAGSLDYFMYEPFFSNSGTASAVQSGSDVFTRMIDVRSHRKLEELNQSLIMELSAIGRGVAADSTTLVGDLSILVALA